MNRGFKSQPASVRHAARSGSCPRVLPSPAAQHLVTWRYYGFRQLVASTAWIANDFAFYGNKLQQGVFLALLFPGATPYVQVRACACCCMAGRFTAVARQPSIRSEEDWAPAQARACVARCQDADGGTDLCHGATRT